MMTEENLKSMSLIQLHELMTATISELLVTRELEENTEAIKAKETEIRLIQKMIRAKQQNHLCKF